MKRARTLPLLLGLGSSAVAACSLLTSLDGVVPAAGLADGAMPGPDGGADGAGDGAAVDVVEIYSALDDKSNWTTFDTTSVNAASLGFQGGVFDGRYLYFAPFENSSDLVSGIITRYDTQAPFDKVAGWNIFDVSTVGGAKGFIGGVFDGRFAYFVASIYGSAPGLMTRYDTQAGFSTPSSWATFDMTSVNAGARGYASGAYDGRYVYFAPAYNGTKTHGVICRYDTQGDFTTGGAWAAFDVATVNAAATGYYGAVFDGRYLYFVPSNLPATGPVARYDTTAPFAAASSWTTFDTSPLSGAEGFLGGTFDGRYVYFTPDYNTGVTGVVVQYDTQADFTAVASWSKFDVHAVPGGGTAFFGTAFDGRYVYFVPDYSGVFDGAVDRYDTQAPFTSVSSWSTFDVASVNPGAKGFSGAAFDGRYLYLIPNANADVAGKLVFDGIVARFDAKQPRALPPGYAHGSFF